MKISVVLGVFNEARNIKDCLESVMWADEIVIIDDGSTDKTVEIAKKYTEKIYSHKSEGYVEPTRNFGISKAAGDWILLLDADERIPETLAEKLKEVANSDADYVWIPRKNIIFNEWIRNEGWWPDYNVRFFRKGKVRWSDKIHSKPELEGLELKLEEDEKYAILHNNYQTISQFLEKLDRYTTIEAQEFIRSKKKFSPNSLISHPIEEFLSRMFAREGYKDGYHGFLLSSLEAFSMQIAMAKVWEREGFKDVESREFIDDLRRESSMYKGKIKYWVSTFLIKNTRNPVKKTILRTVRKFSSK